MNETGTSLMPGYAVLEVLGQGGFGVVYRAKQLAVGREVALKLDNRLLVSERDRRRFMREVTSAGALSGHPHVVDVYDAGVLPDGRPYMVLELCPGGSLADRMRREGTLGAAEVRDIGIKIADALAAAHALGVLHRDVKPANILINSYGLVALSDFGLATMPGPGQGEVSVTRESLTPAYAPPEAFELGEPTAAGDVYALAATLYALMYGRPPRFPESGVVNIATIMALHRLPIPDIPGVPSGLTAVLRAGMASEPQERIQTAGGLRDALAALEPDGSAGPGGVPLPLTFTAPLPPGPASPPTYPPTRPAPGTGSVPDVRVAGSPQVMNPLMTGPHGGAPHISGPRPAGPYASGPHLGGLQSTGPYPPGGAAAASPTNAAHLGPAAASAVAPSRGVSRQSLAFGTVAAIFALLLTVGLILLAMENQSVGVTGARTTGAPKSNTPSKGDSPSQASTALGVPTWTDNCPAARVPGANAACVTTPECWMGLVNIMGNVEARQVDCAKPHAWETFAIAPLPQDVTTYYMDTVKQHPTVAKLCAKSVLLQSRSGKAKSMAADKWTVNVLPPNEAKFLAGIRVYRCIGRIDGPQTTGSLFAAS